jgi:hypothetical protein
MLPLWRDAKYLPQRPADAGSELVLELRPR